MRATTVLLLRGGLLAIIVLMAAAPARADGVSLPPGERPVQVQAGVFLLNLSGVGERSESFDADLYLSLRWRDPRLAFTGSEPRRFLEDAAAARLGEIWWPQLEFVNTAQPAITNRVLEIAPDGAVYYRLGLSSRFRAHFDLRRFPFDRQTLAVRIQSFFWTADQMVFVPETARIGFNPDSTVDALRVTQVDAVVDRDQLAGWELDFADLFVRIGVERQPAFYVWTVFVPVTLIFLISCAGFAVPMRSFQDRLAISLTALLASVATQFAISFDLPRISYLTVIDRIFVVTYACIAIGVGVSTLEATLFRDDRSRVARIDRWAGAGLPVLFLTLLVACVVWEG
jgi:hypothetical protein